MTEPRNATDPRATESSRATERVSATDRRAPEPVALPEPVGDAVCWLPYVCAECGRLDERRRPGEPCTACGATPEEAP